MVDLPTTFLPPAEDKELPRPPRSAPIFDDDSASTVSLQNIATEVSPFDIPEVGRMTKLKGHPCAAGCGHFCWAASGETDDL